MSSNSALNLLCVSSWTSMSPSTSTHRSSPRTTEFKHQQQLRHKKATKNELYSHPSLLLPSSPPLSSSLYSFLSSLIHYVQAYPHLQQHHTQAHLHTPPGTANRSNHHQHQKLQNSNTISLATRIALVHVLIPAPASLHDKQATYPATSTQKFTCFNTFHWWAAQ